MNRFIRRLWKVVAQGHSSIEGERGFFRRTGALDEFDRSIAELMACAADIQDVSLQKYLFTNPPFALRAAWPDNPNQYSPLPHPGRA
jgi:hypothetical protein